MKNFRIADDPTEIWARCLPNTSI